MTFDVQASARECRGLLSSAFAPHISITASQDAEDLCKAMGFAGLQDLLRPFGDKVSGRVTVRDSQAASNTFEDFSVRFTPTVKPASQMPKKEVPLSPGSFHSFTNSSYTLYQKTRLEESIAQLLLSKPDSLRHDAIYQALYKKLIFTMPVSPYETFSHPVAGIIAISSNNHQPIETLSMLYNQSSDPPEYINKEYLRYYVLIHDEQSDLAQSIALFEKMKRHFGLQCHMIRVNRTKTDDASVVDHPPSQWAKYEDNDEIEGASEGPVQQLHAEDHESLRNMVRELVVQSVIPFMERCINTWNDQIASSRRSLTGRFFGASRKYFTSSAKSAGNYNSTTLTYPALSPEAQLRKLADFAFMLRDYKFAFSIYELLKRDFQTDKAWGYLAGTQEMCAVSYLLSPDGLSLSVKSRVDIIESMMELAIYSYISRSGMPTYALRCILMCAELMCTTRSPTAASEGSARWILKALNEKLVGPLGSAILLERVSNCYSCHSAIAHSNYADSAAKAAANGNQSTVGTKNTRDRKAAFWMLLAAREWAASGEERLPEVSDCIAVSQETYGDLAWAQADDVLLGKLKKIVESKHGVSAEPLENKEELGKDRLAAALPITDTRETATETSSIEDTDAPVTLVNTEADVKPALPDHSETLTTTVADLKLEGTESSSN